MSVYIKSVGDPEKPPVVLLHGWGMNGDIWHEWAKSLTRDFFVIIPDFPGLGRSVELPSPYSLEHIAATIVAQLPAVCPQAERPLIWVGWSLGGLLAMTITKQYPALVRGVITIASTPCFVERENWPLGMKAAVFEQFQTSLKHNATKTLQQFMALMVKGDPEARQQLKLLKSLRSVEANALGLEASLALLLKDLRTDFQQCSVPHQFWFAEQDALVNPAIAKEPTMAATSWLIQNCGHIPFISHPDRCTQQLMAFSRGLADLGEHAHG